MITAAQAKQATIEKLQQLAKEYIINVVEPAINEAAKLGRFYTVTKYDGTKSSGAEVVNILEERGFYAEHFLYDGPNGYDNHITTKWED